MYELGLRRLREVFGLEPVAYPTTKQIGASAEDRTKDLIAAFEDQTIKAVITSLGGDDQITYARYLPKEPFAHNPKPFFGYSDARVLAQVVVGREVTHITSMADIMVWVNGRPVQEWAEFPLAVVVRKLMSALVTPAKWDRAIAQFEEDTQGNVSCERLRGYLRGEQRAAQYAGGLTAQQAHMAVSRNLMAEHIRVYQNHPTDPLGYGVLDGTDTPSKFSSHQSFSTANPEFGDQTAVQFARMSKRAAQRRVAHSAAA